MNLETKITSKQSISTSNCYYQYPVLCSVLYQVLYSLYVITYPLIRLLQLFDMTTLRIAIIHIILLVKLLNILGLPRLQRLNVTINPFHNSIICRIRTQTPPTWNMHSATRTLLHSHT